MLCPMGADNLPVDIKVFASCVGAPQDTSPRTTLPLRLEPRLSELTP
jgi:hypothetical protein